MSSQAESPQDVCTECGSILSAAERHCSTCRADAGAPNVRACRTKENLEALVERYEGARSQAQSKGYAKEFNTFEEMIRTNSCVVVAMPASVARQLLEDQRTIYANYETLVGSGIQKAKRPDLNQHRFAAGGSLFGSYASSIIYGVLSLSEVGLPTYGTVYCRLRPVTINKRTSFLETNIYRFFEEHAVVVGGRLPLGYRACWDQCYKLVLAKLADYLSTGQDESDWQAMLIQTDGKNRTNDNYIEAHIFDSFDRNAIESLIPVPQKKISKHEKLDLDIAISKFTQLRAK